MSPETDDRERRLEQLFKAALELDRGAREELLSEGCAGDPALRDEVWGLLCLDDARVELLDEPLVTEALADDEEHPPVPARPPQIACYEVLEFLGRGGMGVVWLARRAAPLARLFAIKVVRAGVGDTSLHARIENEQRLLAQLDHDNIARIVDSGTTEDGEPYFVMEYVEDGIPLTRYCEERDLSTRLELFVRVCEGAHHGHERGVLHRDLKPANVLVGRSGEPKIIDFGIARNLNSDMEVSRALTRTGLLLGTLEYMSPEQLAGDPARLDARSDVYSLGVMLYELACGRTPHELEGRSVFEMMRIVREEPVLRPGSFGRRLPVDLETVILKALEREPQRRYASAAELAQDLRDHIAQRPVQARPPSAAYQLRDLVRRHRALAAAALGVLLVSLVGTAISLSFAIDSQRARREAENGEYHAGLVAAQAELRQGARTAAFARLQSLPQAPRGWEWRHLVARARTDRQAVGSPLSGQMALGWDAAGEQLMLRESEAVRACDAATGQLTHVRPFDGTYPVWSPTGKLAQISPDPGDPARAALRVVAWPDDTQLGHVSVPADSRPLAWSRDGERLALGHSNSVELRSMPDGAVLASYALPGTALWAEFDASGSALLVRSEDAPAVYLDLVRGARESLGDASTRLCALSPGGRRVLLVDPTGRVRIHARSEDGWTRTHDLLAHAHKPSAATWSPGGERFATAACDGTLHVWDAREAVQLRSFRAPASSIDLAWSPDGEQLLVVPSSGQAEVLGPLGGALEVVLRGHASYVNPVVFIQGGRVIASGGWDGYVGERGALRFWDAVTGEALGACEDFQIVVELQPDPQGHGLIVVSMDAQNKHATSHVDALSGRSTPWNPATPAGANEELKNLARRGRLVSSPDGRTVAGPLSKRILVGDARTLQLRHELVGHEAHVNGLAFDPKGERLASAARDATLRVWDVRTGEQLARLEHTRSVLCARYSPDGTRLVSGGRDRFVHVWDATSFEPLVQLDGHEEYVYSLAFSPDGERLISGSGDGSVRIWDTLTAAQRAAARRERLATLERVTPALERLRRESADWSEVARRVTAAADWSEEERGVALQEVLRSSLAP